MTAAANRNLPQQRQAPEQWRKQWDRKMQPRWQKKAEAPTAAEQGIAAASAVAEEAGAASTAETAGQGAAAEAETGVGDRGTDIWKDGRDSGDSRGTVVEGADRASGKNASEHSGSDWQRGDFAGGEQEEVFVDTLSEEGPEVAKLMAQEEAAQEQPVLNEKLTAEQFLQKLGRALAQNGGFGFAGMQKLLPERNFRPFSAV